MPHWITPTRSWASEAKEVRNRNQPLRSLSTSDLSIVEIDSSFSEFMAKAMELTRDMKSEKEREYIAHLKTI
jgi:hypothetical protein